MRKSTKTTPKERKYIITFPDGTTMIPGPGNVPTSHEGVPAEDFSKALAKAAKEASAAGIFDTEDDIYDQSRSAHTR